MDDLQLIGLRDLLCGMHVHVQLPDGEDRVDVMTRMLPYLPLFVALSTSSPFWTSHCTGLKSYRLAAYDELPRTGVPELFRKTEEFEAYIEALTKAGAIENSSYIWWAIRPSLKHPTLELRAPDSCTFVDDSVAIAALYRSLDALRSIEAPLLTADALGDLSTASQLVWTTSFTDFEIGLGAGMALLLILLAAALGLLLTLLMPVRRAL
jgi:carboxylate-amine ligase